jgi:hypothetical protein
MARRRAVNDGARAADWIAPTALTRAEERDLTALDA